MCEPSTITITTNCFADAARQRRFDRALSSKRGKTLHDLTDLLNAPKQSEPSSEIAEINNRTKATVVNAIPGLFEAHGRNALIEAAVRDNLALALRVKTKLTRISSQMLAYFSSQPAVTVATVLLNASKAASAKRQTDAFRGCMRDLNKDVPTWHKLTGPDHVAHFSAACQAIVGEGASWISGDSLRTMYRVIGLYYKRDEGGLIKQIITFANKVLDTLQQALREQHVPLSPLQVSTPRTPTDKILRDVEPTLASSGRAGGTFRRGDGLC